VPFPYDAVASDLAHTLIAKKLSQASISAFKHFYSSSHKRVKRTRANCLFIFFFSLRSFARCKRFGSRNGSKHRLRAFFLPKIDSNSLSLVLDNLSVEIVGRIRRRQAIEGKDQV
jgi:hypothetical protein